MSLQPPKKPRSRPWREKLVQRRRPHWTSSKQGAKREARPWHYEAPRPVSAGEWRSPQSDQPQPRSECWWRPEVMRKRMAQQIVTQGGAGGAGTGFLGGRNRERQQLAMRQRRPQPSPVAQHVPGGGAVAEGGPGTDFDGGGGSGFPVDGAHPQSGVATAGPRGWRTLLDIRRRGCSHPR